MPTPWWLIPTDMETIWYLRPLNPRIMLPGSIDRMSGQRR